MNWDIAINNYKTYLKLEKNLSDNTIENYLRDIYKLINHYPDSKPKSIDSEKLREFNYQIGKKYASRSQARILSGVRSFFDFLVEDEIRKDNPAIHIDIPKIGLYLPDTLNKHEVDKIIGTIDLSETHGERNRAIFEMLYGCGLRVSELVELKLSDLFLDEDFIRVIGKGNKERLVPIAKYTQRILINYIKLVRVHLKINSKFSDHIFINNRGNNLSRVMIFNIVKKHVKLAGITKTVSPHTFRHSFATHLLENGADLRSIQIMLGHESISTTEIYTHIDKSFVRENIEKYHPRIQLEK